MFLVLKYDTSSTSAHFTYCCVFCFCCLQHIHISFSAFKLSAARTGQLISVSTRCLLQCGFVLLQFMQALVCYSLQCKHSMHLTMERRAGDLNCQKLLKPTVNFFFLAKCHQDFTQCYINVGCVQIVLSATQTLYKKWAWPSKCRVSL